MKKEKQQRCDTPDFMSELNGDSDETELANLERFISEDTSDGMINADTFKDLISEIHDLPPEFMEEFDFGTSEKAGAGGGVSASNASGELDGSRTVDSIVSRLKQEEVEAADREIQAAMLDIGKQMQSSGSMSTSTSGTSTLTTTSGSFSASFDAKIPNVPPTSGSSSVNTNRAVPPFGNPGPPELSPAALTLKQMAEQHQHKAQMGMTPAAMTPSTGLSAPPTMPNQGAPMVQPQHHLQPGNTNNQMRPNMFPGQQQQQHNNQQQYNPAGNQFMNHPRPPYVGQGGYGPNSPMIKKEIPYFANSPLSGNSPGPGRPVQQPQQVIQPAKSSPVPLSQSSPMAGGPLTPQQMQHQQQQQQHQQFNAQKAPTPTSNSRTPPPSGTVGGGGATVQFSQSQQQQIQMTNNGQQIQVQYTTLQSPV